MTLADIRPDESGAESAAYDDCHFVVMVVLRVFALTLGFSGAGASTLLEALSTVMTLGCWRG